MTLITIGSSTDLGKREMNEDSLLAVVSQDSVPRGENPSAMGSSALLILADGMGGRASGQIASQTAVRVVYRELAHILALRPNSQSEYIEKALQNSLRQANTKIQNLGNGNPKNDGMGTTCTVAVIVQDAVTLAHVGDTRAYLLTNGSPLRALTEDHSIVHDEVRAGRLTEAQARRSQFRNVITRAVGVESSVTADIISYPLPPGILSRLVISSDGLHGALTEGQIEEILRAFPDPHEAATELVTAAKERGASDNISAIVACIQTNVKSNTNSSEGSESDSHRKRRSHAGAGFFGGHLANIAAFAIGVVVMAVAGLLLMPHEPSGSNIAAVHQPIDLTRATYGAPEPLLGKSVLPSVLLRSGDDIIVVDPSAKRVLRVSTSNGQVLTSVADNSRLAESPAQAQYWTVDSFGDIYESQPSPPQVRKYGPDGTFLRTIGQGVLVAPAAIAIAPSGDLFVIDNGVLERLKVAALSASTSPAAGAETAPASAQ